MTAVGQIGRQLGQHDLLKPAQAAGVGAQSVEGGAFSSKAIKPLRHGLN